MKKTAIQALLADPNIDPTSWVGPALIEWIGRYPREALKDKAATKYLFQGMEPNDVRSIAPHIVRNYEASQDREILQGFISGANRALNEDGGVLSRWAINEIVRELHSIVDERNINIIVQFEHPTIFTASLSEKFIDITNANNVRLAIRNLKPQWSSCSDWTKILQKFPREELVDFGIDTLIPSMNINGVVSAYPSNFMWVLYALFLRIPEKDAPRWLNAIKDVDFRPLWASEKESISKRRKSGPIKLDETVCRCGVVASTISGMSLHRKNCSSGDQLGIIEAAKLLAAKADPMSCSKCAKVCKTTSGLTLHTKNCDSNLGLELEQLRTVTQKIDEKNANRLKNQMS